MTTEMDELKEMLESWQYNGFISEEDYQDANHLIDLFIEKVCQDMEDALKEVTEK